MSEHLEAAKARSALDLLAQLRLRTAPHTSEARTLNTELRTGYRLKRPVDALRAWESAVGSEPSEEVVRKAVMEWSLAIGLHAAINLEDLKATRPAVESLGQVGRSHVMDTLRTQTWRAVFTDDVRKALALTAPHRLSVLITGEPGTGKEIVARTIAAGRGSLDPDGEEPGPYIAINIASLSPSLASSDLFGHVRGAYTGATRERDGLFQAATGGVLFLDEIGDAPPEVQVRLLRTLQEGTVRPVGADFERKVVVRVLAATNRDLSADGDKAFRQDLLERLSVLRVECPPLREREEDLTELVRHFVAEEIDLGAWPTIVDTVQEKLLAETRGYTWPGNVRELRACTNRVLAGQPALLGERGDSFAASPRSMGDALVSAWGTLPLERVKHHYADAVLRSVGGNKSEAARLLGIDRNTLSRYVKHARAADDLSEEAAQ
jgi:DNA-binding NtrC family response regulator